MTGARLSDGSADHYVIRGGLAGRVRLRVLARVMWPTTRELLARAAGVGNVEFRYVALYTELPSLLAQAGLVAPYGGSGRVNRSASSCRDGTEVVVYELADMDHAWPGAAADDPMAAPDAPVSANDLLWEFFERHRGGPDPASSRGCAGPSRILTTQSVYF